MEQRSTSDGIRGRLTRISGPMITASGMSGVAMGELVRVGAAGLLAEVIRVDGDTVYAQVFEETQGLALHEYVIATGAPLAVELGPGLLGGTYDGIQRPLTTLLAASGPFVGRGLTAPALDRAREWPFETRILPGQKVFGGQIIGVTTENGFEHRILVPPNVQGEVAKVTDKTSVHADEPVAWLNSGVTLSMMQRWPVKTPRPCGAKLPPEEPFLTGQRVLDCLFPLALGGAAIVPGGFGTGKTVVEQTLAKYCNAEIIVYVGCGERGNEMADVLDEFPQLTDPRTGAPMMTRTVLIVNTSNMPVAARDASVYTGITIAEYYRDQGYSVALMADSTSRWAEALREISSRLEEMPGEEGYPTYLAARIAEFYERAGRVVCAGDDKRIGALTLVGAVSPPGGDFSEPVTQTSLRVAGALWALDASLAYRRHYPAINWNRSYSLYVEELEPWFRANAPEGWTENRRRAMALLQRDAELQEVVQLVGPDALQESERLVLEAAKLFREVFLQQNAFSEADAHSRLDKTNGLLRVILAFYDYCSRQLEKGTTLDALMQLPARENLARLPQAPADAFGPRLAQVLDELESDVNAVEPVET